MPTKKQEEPAPIIAKITIQIGDVKAPVTLDQARKLHAALSEMFGVKEVEKVVYRDNWHWPWRQPYWSYSNGFIGGSNYSVSCNSSDYCGSNLNKMNDTLSGISNLQALGNITVNDKPPVTLTANTDYCLCIE